MLTGVEDPEPSETPSSLIPVIALLFVPFVMILLGQTEPGIDRWMLLVESAVCGFLLLPFYAVYLVSVGWKRFRDGTLNEVDAVIGIVSFILILGFCVLAMTVAGMGSPA